MPMTVFVDDPDWIIPPCSECGHSRLAHEWTLREDAAKFAERTETVTILKSEGGSLFEPGTAHLVAGCVSPCKCERYQS